MKNRIAFVFLATLIISCGNFFELLELKIDNNLTESVAVSIPKTVGTSGAFNLTKTLDLRSGDFAKYVDKITAVKINSFTYIYKDFTGNTDGVIQSGTLKFDSTEIGTITNLNISQAASAGTVFSISDGTVISQLEDAFVNNSSTVITLAGNGLSDAGPMDFKIEVHINLTATIKQ
ncbi:hypothetical protein KCTC32516_00738 [Polaribacter huanghezhanensis]|uniref:hypothetical protein n=1 Tax=Polaribacter huanghezhanensis TaxID=1354726 RepID=UPI002649F3C6|nr:hypothetical protein [Polaribacter huanghezhanensis]WKD85398.1 hypothetical protein KCTC32516_00738 [Polaribacter huanghezhanensis]